MPYSSEAYLELFDKSFFETVSTEEKFENLRPKDIYRYRVKTIRSGKVLECEIFPIWNTQNEARRAKKAKESRPAQKNLNDKNTKKNAARLANNNFTGADIWATFGYDDENIPPTPEQARSDIINYLRRVKRMRDKAKLPTMKYIYVTEWKEETDEEGDAIRVHHHVIMSGGIDRDEVEQAWRGGGYPQARRLQPKDRGITGLAKYITKGKKGQKLWGHSTNLKMPVPTVADRKITKRQAEKIAIDENSAPALFEKLYKGYVFDDVQAKYSNFVAGAYIYVQMHQAPTTQPRKSKKPKKEGIA